MKIQCPQYDTCKAGNQACLEYEPDFGCSKNATAEDLIEALEALRPDCKKCVYSRMGDGKSTRCNCIWFMGLNNLYKEYKKQ
jgi:hypothetical protein